MMNKILLVLTGMISTSCVTQSQMSQQMSSQPIAFPGAEGFGKYTTGGRGG
jgi:hypothetical protein